MATILDDVLVVVILVLSIRWLISLKGSGSTVDMVIGSVSALALIAYVVAFYVALSVGMTPGKWLLGIRVIDKRNGDIPGLGRMFVREVVGKIVSGFFAGLGFFWAIWDRDSQAWHDKIAGTVVVRRDSTLTANQPSGAWPSLACFALFTLLCLQSYSAMTPSWSRDTDRPTDNEAFRQSNQPGQAVSESAAPPVSNPSEGPVVFDASTQTTNGDATTQTDETPQTGAISNVDRQEATTIKSTVGVVLSEWASAMAANDASSQSSYYADHVSRYFLARDVTNAFVLGDKQSFLNRGSRIASFEIQQLNFENVSSDNSTVSLVKVYEVVVPGAAPITRTVHSRLWLDHTSDGWKIVGEQDLLP